MSKIVKEVQTLNNFVSWEDTKKAANCICQVMTDKGKASGFFMVLPYFSETLKTLVTSTHVINPTMIDYQSSLTISYLDNKVTHKLTLSHDRKIFTFNPEEEDVTIIQLQEGEVSNELFLELDSNFREFGPEFYVNKIIILFQHPNGLPLQNSNGNILKIDNFRFTHNAASQYGSSGSPIILPSSLKIIGMHWGADKGLKENYGTFMGYVVRKINSVNKIYPNGDRYEGEWKNDKRNGRGTYYFKNGDKYIGNFKDNKRDGKGVFYNSGDKYEGSWKEDKKNGKGTFYFSNGDKYIGDWKNNMFNGKGTFIFADGDKYEGDFKNDERCGKGIYTYIDGSKYEGSFKNDKKNGKGIFFYPNGDKYEGNFENGMKNGEGIYFYGNGERYEGNFINDVREGKGTFFYENGDIYKGFFKNGMKDGGGIFLYKNGERFEGEWRNNKREGKGKLHMPNGEVIEAEWKDDEKISNCVIF